MSVIDALQHATGVPALLWSSLIAAALLLLSGFIVRARIVATNGGVLPDDGFSLRNVFEVLVEMLASLSEEIMGPNWRKYFPLVGTIFFFILVANLLGLLPGLGGSTRDSNTTWAWAIISFVAHQYVGVKEHGFGYVNHFLGPALMNVNVGGRTIHLRLLAPLYAPIEILSHLARMFTLSVRLLANMFADHLVVGVWITLVPAIVPALFMGLGVLVAFLQAYVFAMLSMIYIGLALEEAH